ncbi:MAG: hypothetical protein CL946_07820 [Ectothiorhodospiraceae bacterium]|nr:hypothetical protein [Ectothiorhodospiraceae bacterium]
MRSVACILFMSLFLPGLTAAQETDRYEPTTFGGRLLLFSKGEMSDETGFSFRGQGHGLTEGEFGWQAIFTYDIVEASGGLVRIHDGHLRWHAGLRVALSNRKNHQISIGLYHSSFSYLGRHDREYTRNVTEFLAHTTIRIGHGAVTGDLGFVGTTFDESENRLHFGLGAYYPAFTNNVLLMADAVMYDTSSIELASRYAAGIRWQVPQEFFLELAYILQDASAHTEHESLLVGIGLNI